MKAPQKRSQSNLIAPWWLAAVSVLNQHLHVSKWDMDHTNKKIKVQVKYIFFKDGSCSFRLFLSYWCLFSSCFWFVKCHDWQLKLTRDWSTDGISLLQFHPPIPTAQARAPNEQDGCVCTLDIVTSFLYSGRKWRRPCFYPDYALNFY